MVVFWQIDVGFQAGVDFDNSVQAVQLVRHAGGEDGFVLIPDDGGRQIVIELGALDVLEAHAYRNQFVPGGESFGLEEVGCVVGRERLVDLEGCDLGRDCVVLVYERCDDGMEGSTVWSPPGHITADFFLARCDCSCPF